MPAAFGECTQDRRGLLAAKVLAVDGLYSPKYLVVFLKIVKAEVRITGWIAAQPGLFIPLTTTIADYSNRHPA